MCLKISQVGYWIILKTLLCVFKCESKQMDF